MLLGDAVKCAEKLLPTLTGRDAAAIHALIEMAKRVQRFQKPLRDLSRGLLPDELTQTSLFSNNVDDG